MELSKNLKSSLEIGYKNIKKWAEVVWPYLVAIVVAQLLFVYAATSYSASASIISLVAAVLMIGVAIVEGVVFILLARDYLKGGQVGTFESYYSTAKANLWNYVKLSLRVMWYVAWPVALASIAVTLLAVFAFASSSYSSFSYSDPNPLALITGIGLIGFLMIGVVSALAFYRTINVVFALYIAVEKGTWGKEAIVQSKALAKPIFWKIFGNMIVLSIVIGVISGVISAVFGVLGSTYISEGVRILVAQWTGFVSIVFFYNIYNSLTGQGGQPVAAGGAVQPQQPQTPQAPGQASQAQQQAPAQGAQNSTTPQPQQTEQNDQNNTPQPPIRRLIRSS